MPHPENAVTFETSANLGAPALDNQHTLALLDVMTAANLPDSIEFDTVYEYSDPATVADHFGEGSDLHIEAQAAEAERAENYRLCVLEATTQTEVLGDSASSQDVTAGTLTDVPLTGFADSAVTITVDGTEMTTTAVTTSPPTLDDGSVATGEAIYNPDTGEVKTGTSTSGSGTGIEVSYATVSWSDGLLALQSAGTDIAVAANKRYDRRNAGDLDELVMWSDSNDITLPMPYLQGGQVGDISAEQDLASDVGSFAPGRMTYPVANDSTDSLGGYIGGRLAVNDAGYNLAYEDFTVNTGSPRYTPANVGEPGSYGTFEGGNSNGAGMTNVLVNYGGAQLSNSLTTAGETSPYRYLDVARREAFIKREAKDILISLLDDASLDFEDGKTIIEEALRSGLREYMTGEDRMFIDIVPSVPEGLDVSAQNRKNRVWENIQLDLYPTIPVHSMHVEQRMQLAEDGYTTTLA